MEKVVDSIRFKAKLNGTWENVILKDVDDYPSTIHDIRSKDGVWYLAEVKPGKFYDFLIFGNVGDNGGFISYDMNVSEILEDGSHGDINGLEFKNLRIKYKK